MSSPAAFTPWGSFLEKRFPHAWHHHLKRLPLLWIVALAAYMLIVSTGFGPYLTDHFSFRQTQTAITARYFSGAADFLFYATPVVGPPWSIPFEFPLYQAIAKGLHVASRLSLETSGRLVSVAFFLLCFWPLHLLLRAFGVDRTVGVMMPVLFAPLYVFWSRSFMIETTALFFSLLFLALVVQVVRQPRSGASDAARFLALTVAGMLAALTKVTTLAPMMLPTVAATAWLAVRALRGEPTWRRAAGLATVHAIVLATALVWVGHTDAVKQLNPIGEPLTSAALRSWNYGTLAQRLDPLTWLTLADRTIDVFYPLPAPTYSRLLAALKLALVLGWLLLFVWFLLRGSAARRRQVGVLCAMYLLPFLLFTNLHRVHSYYQTANAVFLCLAFGLAACGAIETAPDRRTAWRRTGFYAAALLSFGLTSTWLLQHRSSREGELVELSDAVRQMSPAGSVIVASGLDWSSVLPYQSSRRALMLPNWATPAMTEAALEKLRASGEPLSLYISCGKPTTLDAQARKLLHLGDIPPARRIADCTIHPL